MKEAPSLFFFISERLDRDLVIFTKYTKTVLGLDSAGMQLQRVEKEKEGRKTCSYLASRPVRVVWDRLLKQIYQPEDPLRQISAASSTAFHYSIQLVTLLASVIFFWNPPSDLVYLYWNASSALQWH